MKAINLVLILFLLASVSASWELGNKSYEISSFYGPSESIRGWINISFDEEPANSEVSSLYGDDFTLLDFLKEVEEKSGFDYYCDVKNCEFNYETSNGEEIKSFILEAGKSVKVGLKLSEDLTDINSIGFRVLSNAKEACSNQLSLDFFSNTGVIIGNPSVSGNFCGSSKTFSCFDESKTYGEADVTEKSYCNILNLSDAPGIRVGAWVREKGETEELTLTLYNEYASFLGECLLSNISSEGGEVFCDINVSVLQNEKYSLCINSESSNRVYSIRHQIARNDCGYYALPSSYVSSTNNAYSLFVQNKKFGDVGEFRVNNSVDEFRTLGQVAKEYLLTTYGNLDCSSGCILPITINSFVNQRIDLSDLEISYETAGTSGSIIRNFYDIREIPPKISTENFEILNLEGSWFPVAPDYGNKTFEIEIDGDSVFSEKVSVEKVPSILAVAPWKVAAGNPTEFKAYVNYEFGNISEYNWDFGDGDSKKTSGNKIVHTYNETGVYDLELEVKSKEISILKSFIIEVETPEFIINSSLEKMQENLESLNSQIKKFDVFSQAKIKETLNFEELESELSSLQRAFNEAEEEDLQNILERVLKLKVPESVVLVSEENEKEFYPSRENVDISSIVSIDEEDFESSDEQKYVDGVLVWNQENLLAEVNLKKYSFKYDGVFSEYLSVIQISISERNSVEDDSYFFVEKMKNISFDDNYWWEDLSDFSYLELQDFPFDIKFSVRENLRLEDLSIFISPLLGDLDLDKPYEPLPKSTNISGKVVLFWFLGFLVLGSLAYFAVIFISKKRRELDLFGSSTKLKDLLKYIEESKKRNIPERMIKLNLSRQRWKIEQIEYAFQKSTKKIKFSLFGKKEQKTLQKPQFRKLQ